MSTATDKPFDERLLVEMFGEKALIAVNNHETLVAALNKVWDLRNDHGALWALIMNTLQEVEL